MAIAATIAGYADTPIAKALPSSVMCHLMIAFGFGMFNIFFARQFFCNILRTELSKILQRPKSQFGHRI